MRFAFACLAAVLATTAWAKPAHVEMMAQIRTAAFQAAGIGASQANAAHSGTIVTADNKGAFNGGVGNKGAFNGLKSPSDTSGNYNTGN